MRARKFRSRLYLLAVIAGVVMYMSEYKSWFALKNYRIEAQSQALEQRLWDIFPQRCLTFWPYLLKDSRGISEYLERDMPVKVYTEMRSFGKFITRIEWLRAWVKVDWRGKIWSISRDGMMWLTEQGRPDDDNAGRLIWKIPLQANTQDDVNIQAPMNGVFKSPVSTEVISSFLDEFQSCRWFKEAEEITWERRAGMDLFTLKLSHGTQKFELFLQREKYPGQDVGAMIDDLFSQLISDGGNHIIDATYEGKILLRNL